MLVPAPVPALLSFYVPRYIEAQSAGTQFETQIVRMVVLHGVSGMLLLA